MINLNPYEELGVARDANSEEISRAYRRKSKKAHPDAGGSPEDWKRLGTAVDVLRDPAKRKTYDDHGRIEEDKPDIDGAAALGILNQQISTIVNDFIGSDFSPGRDPRALNIPKVIAARIRLEINQGRDALKVGQRVVETIQDIARRFSKRKTEGEIAGQDPIARQFKDQIDQSEQQMAALRQSIRYHELALQIVETYDFRFDIQSAPDGFHDYAFNRRGQ